MQKVVCIRYPVSSHAPRGRASHPRSPASRRPARTSPTPSVWHPRCAWRSTPSKVTGDLVAVTISRNEHGSPAETLADADVIVHGEAGPLTELTVIGFAVWERRDGGRHVTFPARPYSLNGTRRSLAL